MSQTVRLHHYRLAIYDLVTAMWLCRDNKHLKNDVLFQNSGVKPAFPIMTKSLKTVNYSRTENDIFVSL